jgi:hypothetical protein
MHPKRLRAAPAFRRSLSFLACGILAVAGLSSRASAQYQYDVIAFHDFQVDDDTLGLSSGWLLLVNTGNVSIPLQEWSKAAHYAEFDAAVGGFDLKPVFAGVQQLAPGQAIGGFDPELVNLLQPGETYVNAASSQFQISAPWPMGTTQGLHWAFRLGEREVRGVAQVHFSANPGARTAVRISSQAATTTVASLPSGCASTLTVTSLALPSPYTIAPSSNLPVIGNECFALDVRVNNVPYVLGLDVASGLFPFRGCEIRLGLTPAFWGIYNGGGIVQPLPIPDDPSLVGMHAYLQAAGLGSGSVTLTNGLDVLIGQAP